MLVVAQQLKYWGSMCATAWSRVCVMLLYDFISLSTRTFDAENTTTVCWWINKQHAHSRAHNFPHRRGKSFLFSAFNYFRISYLFCLWHTFTPPKLRHFNRFMMCYSTSPGIFHCWLFSSLHPIVRFRRKTRFSIFSRSRSSAEFGTPNSYLQPQMERTSIMKWTIKHHKHLTSSQRALQAFSAESFIFRKCFSLLFSGQQRFIFLFWRFYIFFVNT